MSDRRPEKLWVPCEHGEIGWHGEMMGGCAGGRWATLADLLAVVRRGVESGTIKGFSVESQHDHVWGESLPAVRGVEPGTYLLVGPVSDGGSET